MNCPLCFQKISDTIFYTDKHRDYIRCKKCCLVFVPEAFFLSKEEEHARYDMHINKADKGYLNFLSQLAEPLLDILDKPSKGLDFGSGPGPCLNILLEAKGHDVSLYDIFYANDSSRLEQSYDFITATEVVEHLYEPGKVLDALWGCIRPGGIFAIMTQPIPEEFGAWWYIKDNTHVSFFHEDTMHFLMKKWGATELYHEKAVWIMRKPT